jgi:hypothetical protein
MWSIWWNQDCQGKLKYLEKTCPRAILFTTNSTWPDLGLNPSRHGGKLATNHLSYGTALIIKITTFQDIMLCGVVKFTNVLEEFIASTSEVKENARQIAGKKHSKASSLDVPLKHQ